MPFFSLEGIWLPTRVIIITLESISSSSGGGSSNGGGGGAGGSSSSSISGGGVCHYRYRCTCIPFIHVLFPLYQIFGV